MLQNKPKKNIKVLNSCKKAIKYAFLDPPRTADTNVPSPGTKFSANIIVGVSVKDWFKKSLKGIDSGYSEWLKHPILFISF